MAGRLTSTRASVRLRAVVLTVVAAALAVTAFGVLGYASPTVSAAQKQYGPEGQIPLPGGGISIPVTSGSRSA